MIAKEARGRDFHRCLRSSFRPPPAIYSLSRAAGFERQGNPMKKLLSGNGMVEKNKISELDQKLLLHDVVSPPLISSLGDAVDGDQVHTNQELVSGGVHHPPTTTFGYFTGCHGVYSNLDNRAYFASQEALKIPYSPAGKVLSPNNHGGDQQFVQGQGIGSLRLSSQMLTNNCRDKMTRKFRGNTVFDVSRELNRGPRAYRREGSSSSGTTKNSLDVLIRRDKYNLQDFQIKYEEAKFFMIKSYSEDDIHKSIKYNVWSSTPNGNTKLDAAFREAEARTKDTTKCPVFLFFSVNASGQFVGLAEMIGPVDFNKNMYFWQQDTWRGFFPVKWHIIKDIPNGLFRNIILENNDNRAVTSSRDTQEIGLPQGLKMLQIFKTFQEETLILDDFGFYEEKEKSRHARRRTSEHFGGVTNCEDSFPKHPHTARTELARSDRTPTFQDALLVTLTKNLSLNAPHRSSTD